MNIVRVLNNVTPGTKRAQLGDIIQLLVDKQNELITKHNAAMAKLDADAGVTDTNYAATLNVAALPADILQD